MTEDFKAPAVPRMVPHRPAQSTRLDRDGQFRSDPPIQSISQTSLTPKDASMLNATTTPNSQLLRPLGRDGNGPKMAQNGTTIDFLPSVSFDDLHSSIEFAATDFKLTQFPSPTGQGSILNEEPRQERVMPDKPLFVANGMATRAAIPQPANRPERSSSLRRPSTSSRQPSLSSALPISSGQGDIVTTTASSRGRRQSHYPPVSSSNKVVAKPPRKSMGPGVVADSETGGVGVGVGVGVGAEIAPKRRPSLRGDRRTRTSTRTSIDGGSSTPSDTSRNVPEIRAAKAKSVQPPPRGNPTNHFLGATLTPENNRLSTIVNRSPRVSSGKASTPSSGGRRASVMPSSHSTSHASGLGARTISPTDTRRMKRLSTMPQSQSLNQIMSIPPPPLMSADARADSKSPSMLPRKASATPSSARTTPDLVSRKSYSSGLSVGSNTSFNTVRTSTGSIQPRLPQTSSASRLPPPLQNSMLNQVAGEEAEDVPPVPAIPKAYESPKDGPIDAYFMEKKIPSTAAAEATSIHSTATSNISMPVYPEPTKAQRRPSVRKSSFPFSSRPEGEPSSASTHSRRHLPPLSLPPLNLGPLSSPTAAKVAKLQQQGLGQRAAITPPPTRSVTKTPTTPMTASKSTFFSKSRYDDTMELPPLRSSTSTHHTRHVTPSPPQPSISSKSSSVVPGDEERKVNLSPFLSSSLPKGGSEHNYMKRSKTGNDFTHTTGSYFEEKPHRKPSGPRALVTDKPVPKSPPPPASAQLNEEPKTPQTPSSISSLRRKLSMSWKRANSKTGTSSLVDTAGDKSAAQVPVRQDSMPPPRLPASATVNHLSSAKQSTPSPPTKPAGGYLESRRRKSSSASLNKHYTHDRVRSDTWTNKTLPADVSTMPTTRSSSTVTKMLRPKASTNSTRGTDLYTAEIDKEDVVAEDEMKKLGSRRKETEVAARTLDALKKRATRKERVGPHEAIRIAMLNIYERGEIVDYNDVYFCGTQNARKVVGDLQSDSPNFGYDDERGDYTIVSGDHLSYRYEVIDILGKGSFGQVVRCIDHKLGVLVAIKIIRNKKRFHQQALVEVNILQKLREWDPHNRHSMVNFTQSFYFRGHLCISTELLDMNLYELIKAHSFRGFSVRIIRRFTKQILSSLIMLKQHKVIHCDMKPENILLRHPLHAEIKVIDFGSSCFENEKVYTYIQSRFYRSPEVILGMTYGLPIDMWSVGCILAELFTGVPIFPGENEQEQLACIMEVFGPPEKHLIEKSTRKKLFFDSMGKPRLTVSTKGRRRRPSSKTLQSVLKCDDEAFLDFLARCLRWDPDRRLRPEDAIRHEFVTGLKRPRTATTANREASPMKRNTTLGSSARPLPEPPAQVTRLNPAIRNGASPHKPLSSVGGVGGGGAAARRISGVTAPTTASVNKRTSSGTGNLAIGASGLPRAAGRTASGKQDVAAAGATVAMSRRS